jgi:hypothetical protein
MAKIINFGSIAGRVVKMRLMKQLKQLYCCPDDGYSMVAETVGTIVMIKL